MRTTISENRFASAVVLAVGCLLLIPLVAMAFSDSVEWSLFDFAAAAVLLLGTGLGFDLATRLTGNRIYRVIIGVALVSAFLVIWAEGAVGIFH